MKNAIKLAVGIVLLTLMFSSVGWSQSVADIVLIIDSSGSMQWNDPTNLRKRAANLFIDLADSTVQVAVVDLDDIGVIDTFAPLTFADEPGKGILKEAVERIDSWGEDNIAAALRQGFNELLVSTYPDTKKAAVLLTDGQDDSDTRQVTSDFAERGWSVYTIGLGNVNRGYLENIAVGTPDGEYHEADLEKIQLVYNRILAKITLKSVVLASPSGYINQDQTVEKRVNIDDWVTQANFTLSWTGSTIEMVLVDPNGAEITPDSAAALNIGYQVAPTYAIYTVDNPMQGEWKMRLTGTDIPPDGEAYSIVVTGASDFVTNFLAFETSYGIGDTVRIGIRVEEKTGDTAQPIIGATTTATIVRPDGQIDTITLFDDGSDVDTAAKDGIYTGNYTNLDKLGTYLIRVSVENGFSREIQQQIIVGAIDNVFIDGSTLIPDAGATLNRAPNLISAVISGPTWRINSDSIVLKIDGEVVRHTYDAVNQLVSFKPAKLSRDMHTVSLSVNDAIETNWTFTIVSWGISRHEILMVLLDTEINILKDTVLGQNYPNPSNPETWIPYQLSQPTDVSIQIYDSLGKLVRTLDIGMKSAGKHITRSRAAYWDGKNEKGERVASGIYFYTFRTQGFSATRRMIIKK